MSRPSRCCAVSFLSRSRANPRYAELPYRPLDPHTPLSELGLNQTPPSSTPPPPQLQAALSAEQTAGQTVSFEELIFKVVILRSKNILSSTKAQPQRCSLRTPIPLSKALVSKPIPSPPHPPCGLPSCRSHPTSTSQTTHACWRSSVSYGPRTPTPRK